MVMSRSVHCRFSRWCYLWWRFLLHGEVELELRREFVLRIEPVREVHSPDATVGMNLREQRSKVTTYMTAGLMPLTCTLRVSM